MTRVPAAWRSVFLNQCPTIHTNPMLHKPRVAYTTLTPEASFQMAMDVVIRMAWSAQRPAAAATHGQAPGGAFSERMPK